MDFIRYLLGNLPCFPAEYVDIKRVNVGLLPPSGDEASTLELGKKVCPITGEIS